MFFGCNFDDKAECYCSSNEDPHLEIKLENSNKAAIAKTDSKSAAATISTSCSKFGSCCVLKATHLSVSEAASKQRSCSYKASWNIRNTFK